MSKPTATRSTAAPATAVPATAGARATTTRAPATRGTATRSTAARGTATRDTAARATATRATAPRALATVPQAAGDPALDEALERISELAARLWAVRSAHRPVAAGWRRATRCAECGQALPCATLRAAG